MRELHAFGVSFTPPAGQGKICHGVQRGITACGIGLARTELRCSVISKTLMARKLALILLACLVKTR